jgi:rhodanese-related sulfurtransferase
MKSKIVILLVMVGNVFWLAGFSEAQQNKIQTVNVQTLKSWMDQSAKITLIDGGSVLACMDARIRGSICLPCDEDKDPSVLSSLPKDAKIIFYSACQPLDPDCGLISKALSAGVKDVYQLDGGLAEWRKAGFPVVSEKRIPRVVAHAVQVKRLADWQQSAKNPLLIDIRSPKAFAAGHLDGAVNFPLMRLHVQYADIPLDRTLLILDGDGRASFLAASYLSRKGFLNVQRLQGGMAAYQRGTR